MSTRPLETKDQHPREAVERSFFSVRSREPVDPKIAPEELFIKMIRTERKRAERSRNPFLLMLTNVSKLSEIEKRKIVEIFLSSLRETDMAGWYESRHITGVIFTEIGPSQPKEVQKAIFARLTAALHLHFHRRGQLLGDPRGRMARRSAQPRVIAMHLEHAGYGKSTKPIEIVDSVCG